MIVGVESQVGDNCSCSQLHPAGWGAVGGGVAAWAFSTCSANSCSHTEHSAH